LFPDWTKRSDIGGAAMPRYYLQIFHGTVTELDDVGLELPSDTEAVAQMTQAITYLRSEEFAAYDWADWTLAIVEGGRTVRRLTLVDFD